MHDQDGRGGVDGRPERLSYLLQAGPGDPPVYLTWLLRPAPGGLRLLANPA